MRAAPRFPDFYLVGAAKSGTTSLFRYLTQHPSIFIPREKELHYFADPSVSRGGSYRRPEAYLRLYENCPEDVRAGDASTSYLPSPSAAVNIREARPDARILAILRNPVERAYSHYWHQRTRFRERLSFEDAIEDEPRRIEAGLTYGFLYVRTGMYYEQVRRFTDRFGAHVQVHLFDDLRSDAAAVCRDTFAFLQVDSDHPVDTRRTYMSSGPLRSGALGRLLVRPFPGRRWLVRHWPHRMYLIKLAILRRNVTRPPAMNRETRLRLTETFRPDIERLALLLGRDLSGWLDAESQPNR